LGAFVKRSVVEGYILLYPSISDIWDILVLSLLVLLDFVSEYVVSASETLSSSVDCLSFDALFCVDCFSLRGVMLVSTLVRSMQLFKL
jgi:hypothetical protein